MGNDQSSGVLLCTVDGSTCAGLVLKPVPGIFDFDPKFPLDGGPRTLGWPNWIGSWKPTDMGVFKVMGVPKGQLIQTSKSWEIQILKKNRPSLSIETYWNPKCHSDHSDLGIPKSLATANRSLAPPRNTTHDLQRSLHPSPHWDTTKVSWTSCFSPDWISSSGMDRCSEHWKTAAKVSFIVC